MSVNTYLNERERRILESAVVGIAGAGGLGSNCAMHLVRAGVKKLVIADFDVVGESNLNRQFFFRDQLGRKKVDALAENLRRIEPDLSLDLRAVRLAPDNIDWTFSGCSVIVEAFDSADAKSMLLHALLPLGKPIVSASGIAGWGRSHRQEPHPDRRHLERREQRPRAIQPARRHRRRDGGQRRRLAPSWRRDLRASEGTGIDI